MSAAQAVVVVSLLAQMYGVDQALMQCIVERESSYNVASQNGIHEGLCQWNPSTREWLAEKAAADPAWLHGNIGAGPVQDVALAAWAIRNGYGSHWATYEGCGGEGMSNNTERRLEIIEARRRNILAEWDPLPARRYNVTVIVDEDVEWLIARVKELEAQAARDAELLTEALRIIDESAINDAAPHIQTIHVSLSDRARG